MDATILNRAHAWIVGDDTGSSSKCLWAVMMGQKPDRWRSHPSDGGDLGRCIRLLTLIPEWRPRLVEMKSVSPYWEALVEAWTHLEEIYARENGQTIAYKKMRTLLDPIEKNDSRVVRLGESTIRFVP